MTFDEWWEKNRRAVIRSPRGFARLVWNAARKERAPVDDMKGLKAATTLQSLGYYFDGRSWRAGAEIDSGEKLQLVAKEVLVDL